MSDEPLSSPRAYERFIYTLSDPHHKHIPPNIKHHRIPAPNLSFTCPNLPFLIEEIEREILGTLAP